MYINETRITVRYVETDQMGIVHHSNYYAWFEVGRTEYIKAQGIKYSEMEDEGVMIPLIESRCEYKYGAKYEDELIIASSIESLTPVKAEFKYEVLRLPDNKLLAVGYTKHAFTDKQLKPINLKKKHPELWGVMNKGM